MHVVDCSFIIIYWSRTTELNSVSLVAEWACWVYAVLLRCSAQLWFPDRYFSGKVLKEIPIFYTLGHSEFSNYNQQRRTYLSIFNFNFDIHYVLQVLTPWTTNGRGKYILGEAESTSSWYSFTCSSQLRLFTWLKAWWPHWDPVEKKQRISLWCVFVLYFALYSLWTE